MKIKTETWGVYVGRVKEWHPHFAWLPVLVSPTEKRWLEWVERKGTAHLGRTGPFVSWEYRPLDETSNETA